jgi:hypothetical protein
MPYVQRNIKAEITGVFANPQPGRAEEFLPDDNPEVVAFNKAHPVPYVPPLTKEEIIKFAADHKRMAEDQREILSEVANITLGWANVENALVLLLDGILNDRHNTKMTAILSTMYFSLSNLESRIGLVDAAIRATFDGNALEKEFEPEWNHLRNKLNGLKKVRNKVAHGQLATVAVGRRNHVRLTSPIFDFQSSREAQKNRQVPGLSASDLRHSRIAIGSAIAIIDAFSEIMAHLRSNDISTLRGTLARLAGQRQKGAPKAVPLKTRSHPRRKRQQRASRR